MNKKSTIDVFQEQPIISFLAIMIFPFVCTQAIYNIYNGDKLIIFLEVITLLALFLTTKIEIEENKKSKNDTH